MALEFIKLVKGDSPVAQVGSLGFFKLGVESGGGGGDLVFSRTFSENTPEQISAVSAVISANNMTSAQVAETFGWNIGDTKDITLTTGEVIQMRITDFNHDDKSDGSGKVGITLEMVNCLNTKSIMRTSSSGNNKGGYTASNMYDTYLPDIYKTIPSEWQNIIKHVDKKSANGGSTWTETIITSEKLFLLAEVELFGTVITAQDGINEGFQYKYWVGKTNEDRIKNAADTAVSWWLRSAVQSNTTSYCRVSSSGDAGSGRSYNSGGVSFAFCV